MRRQWNWALVPAIVLVGILALTASAFAARVNQDLARGATGIVEDPLTLLLGGDGPELAMIGPFGRQAVSASSIPVPLKPRATEIAYNRAWVAEQPTATGADDWACLSEALYFEARGESVRGQFAVAEVILNRVDSSRFPDSVCGVITQGTGKKYQCQFSYKCDGYKEIIREPKAYENVKKVARAMLDTGTRPLTDGATYYHTKAVSPRWSRSFTRTATIGVHYFYRQPVRLSKS